jgi:hypothetical protein
MECLSRSSTSRIESLLRDFLKDRTTGRNEGSIISVDTMRSVQQGNDDVWREVLKEVSEELEEAGITEEQFNEKKQYITDWIIRAFQTGSLEHGSLRSVSFYTATEGGAGSISSGQTLGGESIPAALDFPGDSFRSTKDLAHTVDRVYKAAPPEFLEVQSRIRYEK